MTNRLVPHSISGNYHLQPATPEFPDPALPSEQVASPKKQKKGYYDFDEILNKDIDLDHASEKQENTTPLTQRTTLIAPAQPSALNAICDTLSNTTTATQRTAITALLNPVSESNRVTVTALLNPVSESSRVTVGALLNPQETATNPRMAVNTLLNPVSESSRVTVGALLNHQETATNPRMAVNALLNPVSESNRVTIGALLNHQGSNQDNMSTDFLLDFEGETTEKEMIENPVYQGPMEYRFQFNPNAQPPEKNESNITTTRKRKRAKKQTVANKAEKQPLKNIKYTTNTNIVDFVHTDFKTDPITGRAVQSELRMSPPVAIPLAPITPPLAPAEVTSLQVLRYQLFQTALHHFGNKNYEGVLLATKTLLNKNPTDFCALMTQAITQIAMKKFDEALVTIETALTIHPDHLQAHRAKILALQHLEQFHEAYVVAEQMISLHPKDAIAKSLLSSSSIGLCSHYQFNYKDLEDMIKIENN